MTSVLENFRDDSGDLIQPYYAAFMIEFGFSTVEEGRNERGNQTPFMFWIQARWREFGAVAGITERERAFNRPQFHKWISDRSLDFIARKHVEG